MLEGIYRSSGVKSKVNKLRVAFNSRTCSGVNLNDYEPAVVASVLKLVNLLVLCLLLTPYLLCGICLLILLLCFWSQDPYNLKMADFLQQSAKFCYICLIWVLKCIKWIFWIKLIKKIDKMKFIKWNWKNKAD